MGIMPAAIGGLFGGLGVVWGAARACWLSVTDFRVGTWTFGNWAGFRHCVAMKSGQLAEGYHGRWNMGARRGRARQAGFVRRIGGAMRNGRSRWGLMRGVQARQAGEYSAAMAELRPLAEAGHARAMAIIGQMHAAGQGVVQRIAEAERWYCKAAEAGDAEGQFCLAELYHQSLPLPEGLAFEARDNKIAAHWYGRSAKAGHAGAEARLGMMFFSRDDVFLWL